VFVASQVHLVKQQKRIKKAVRKGKDNDTV